MQLNSEKNPQLTKLKTTTKSYKRVTKNIDLNKVACRYFGGIDLMEIEGVSHSTVLSIMSEIGPQGFKKFQTAKQSASWLRLAPNNKNTGPSIDMSSLMKREKEL